MPSKPKFPMLTPDELKPMTREEADREMEAFFKRLEEELKDVPKEAIEVGANRVVDFLKGNLSWAEIFNVPQKMIRDMVEFGYLQFQAGRYQEAERFFKVLTVLDWNNSYYHSMMGSILQRQKRYGEAIAEYTQAIELNPRDAVSLVNRGEIFLRHGKLNWAEQDFDKAIELDPKKEDKWANRARTLKARIGQVRKGKGKR